MPPAHLRGPNVEVSAKRGCTDKIIYATAREARTAMKRHDRKNASAGKPYHCPHCGQWHITTGRSWPGVGGK